MLTVPAKGAAASAAESDTMYIINRHGVLHSIPDDMRMPAGARKATTKEIEEWAEADAANKAVLRAQKQASAQARAQVVIMAHPSDPSNPPITPIKPISGGEANAKPAK